MTIFPERPNPDQLLDSLKHHDAAENISRNGRGELGIFFGYAAGVGKTYAMLKAAHGAQAQGRDILAGYIEPHDRPATAALLAGLPTLAPVNFPIMALS